MAYKLDFLLDCAELLEGTNYHFLIVGSGAEKEKLISKFKKVSILNVNMLESVPKRDIIQYLSIVDISIINLKNDDLFKNVIPSKIFENIAMYKPILLGVEGGSQELIDKYKVGVCLSQKTETLFLMLSMTSKI